MLKDLKSLFMEQWDSNRESLGKSGKYVFK
jgi:hypothetical protein